MPNTYTQDIFLNYAPSDDSLDHAEGANWVSTFARFLKAVLSEVLERKSRLYISPPSPGQIDDTVICLNVLSEQFFANEQCKSVLDQFAERQKPIFSITRHPDLPELEGSLAERLPYRFFRINEKTGSVEQFEEFKTGKVLDESQFWLSMLDLCYDLGAVIQKAEGTTLQKVKRGNVFLTHSGFDVEDERQLVKRELLRYGYHVLPDKPLPTDEEGIKIAVAESLKQSRFAISLIGEDMGPQIQESQHRLPVLENELAILHEGSVNTGNEHSSNRKVEFKWLIWLKPQLEINSEEQQQFINSIKKDANKRDAVELVQGRVEDFKAILISNLAIQFSDVADHVRDLKGNASKVYLMADHRDHVKYLELSNWLIDKGFSLMSLDRDGSSGERQQQHRKHLENCDYAMVFFDRAKPTWLKTKLQDIIKAPGFGRQRPIKKTIILTGEATPEEAIMMLMDLIPQFESMELMDASSGIMRMQAHLMEALTS